MKKKENAIYIPCSCGASHHIVFTTPEELYSLKKNNTDFLIIQFAIYGKKETTSLRKRLKNAFSHIIKGETAIIDEIIVSKRKAAEIRNFIEGYLLTGKKNRRSNSLKMTDDQEKILLEWIKEGNKISKTYNSLFYYRCSKLGVEYVARVPLNSKEKNTFRATIKLGNVEAEFFLFPDKSEWVTDKFLRMSELSLFLKAFKILKTDLAEILEKEQ